MEGYFKHDEEELCITATLYSITYTAPDDSSDPRPH